MVMAHIEKFKRGAVSGMMHHYRRDRQATLDRENVDESRSHLNYTLGQDLGAEAVAERIESVQEATGKAVRKDANVLASVVVTRPQNVPEGDERKFFESCFEWLSEKLGRENVLGGYVHMDETTPHMHVAFMPVKDGRFNFNKVCPRSFYQTMHQEMSDYVEQHLGYKAEILLDDERHGEKQLSHLSQDEYIHAKQRLESLQQEVEELQPLAEGIGESIRNIVSHRADGERADELGARIEERREQLAGIREQIEAAERARVDSQVRVERMGELRAGIERRCTELRERVEQLANRAIELGRTVVWGCPRRAVDLLRKMGIDARMGKPSLGMEVRDVMGSPRAMRREHDLGLGL